MSLGNESSETENQIDWDEEELAVAASRGDREARNRLYLLQRALVARLSARARGYLAYRAARAGRDVPIDREDIDQQAFVIFCEILEGWKPGSKPFRRVLEQRLPGMLLHYVRHSLRSCEREIPMSNETMLMIQAKIEASQDALRSSRIAWERHLSALPSDLELMVILRYYGDLSVGQIASATGRVRRTVGRDLHRALNIMRGSLEDEWRTRAEEDEQNTKCG